MKKSGFVAVVGRPSAGKSTFVNAVCGFKVSITSPVPQTTRNKVRGIYHDDRGELVFLDTPGYHRSERKFNRALMAVMSESLSEADVVLYLIDPTRPVGEEEQQLAAALAAAGRPIVVAITKADRAAKRAVDAARVWAADHLRRPPAAGETQPEVVAAQLSDSEAQPQVDEAVAASPPAIVPLVLSAVHSSRGAATGVDAVVTALFAAADNGDEMYPPEYVTDQEPRFRAAELIREQVIARLREEVPHAVFVEVVDMEERPHDGLWVRAFIHVERDSQKAMVVGREGSQIRAIRLAAQEQLIEIFERPVHVDLRVKVSPKWRTKDALLQRLVF